jgi:hypothetical protein
MKMKTPVSSWEYRLLIVKKAFFLVWIDTLKQWRQ